MTLLGLSLAGSVFGLSQAQAQNCVISSSSVGGGDGFDGFALGGPGSSPAAVGSMIAGAITASSTAFLLQSTSSFIGSPPNPEPNQEGGGIWVRGVGGELSIKSSTNTSLTVGGSTSGSGSASCFQKVDENFAGVQFGKDVARLNVNGWNFHVGATAGYLETKGNLVGGSFAFADPFGGGNAGGGPFNSTTQVPFIGAYAASTYGDFAIDALLRTEFYQNTLNAPGANIFNQNIDARGVTFASSVLYQWKVPNSDWFIEPSAAIVISRIKVDPFTFVTAGTPGLTAIDATLRLNDIHSDIGRLGLRFGTTINGGAIIWQPFAAVSVWHEFGPNVTSSFATNAVTTLTCPSSGPCALSGTSSTSTIGTFGQYSLGVSAQLAGTGWLGFARVDYRDGADLQGWSGAGGIRYQFTPEGAPRPKTIMPIKAKPPAPLVEAVNWTGFYLGAFGGATQGTADWGYTGGEVAPHIGGYLFGGDVGYNYQTGSYVLGVDASIETTNTKGGTGCGPSLSGGPGTATTPMFEMTCNASANWIATATARAGYAWGRSLWYVKGGGAWTHEEFSATCNNGPNNSLFPPGQACTNPANVISNGLTAASDSGGWVVGFGGEFALTSHWSAKAETNYISFGDRNVTASDGSLLRVGMHLWEEKIGVNYRF